jgi:hypothetical protein
MSREFQQYSGSDIRDPFMSSNQGWWRVLSKSLACALAATALLAVYTVPTVAATEEASPSPHPQIRNLISRLIIKS